MDIIRDVRRVGMLMKIGADRREQAQKSKKPARKQAFLNLAPLTGLEPVTYGLTVRRSTD